MKLVREFRIQRVLGKNLEPLFIVWMITAKDPEHKRQWRTAFCLN